MIENEEKFIDMSKYDNTNAQEKRVELAELKAILYRREYEYNMLVKRMHQLQDEYDDLIGIKELKEAQNA